MSVAQAYGETAVGVLLTGLGRDGSQGLMTMRQGGALTIAQDADSSTVDGMPKAARESGSRRVLAASRRHQLCAPAALSGRGARHRWWLDERRRRPMSSQNNALRLISGWTGIDLSQRGPEILRWLEERAQALGFPSTLSYAEFVVGGEGEETALLLDHVAVQYSWLYRDPQQLELIADLLRERPYGSPPFEIWVPACANGEDAYSIAMLAHQCQRPVRVLATDINPHAVQAAFQGRFPADAGAARRLRCSPILNPRPMACASSTARSCIVFDVHNLLANADADAIGWLAADSLPQRALVLHWRGGAGDAAAAGASAGAWGYLLLGAGEFQFEPGEFERVRIGERWAHVRPRHAASSNRAVTRHWQPARCRQSWGADPPGRITPSPLAPRPARISAPNLPVLTAGRPSAGAALYWEHPAPPRRRRAPSCVARLNFLAAGDANGALASLAPVLSGTDPSGLSEETLLLVGMSEHARAARARHSRPCVGPCSSPRPVAGRLVPGAKSSGPGQHHRRAAGLRTSHRPARSTPT